jgi:hypothetical protein
MLCAASLNTSTKRWAFRAPRLWFIFAGCAAHDSVIAPHILGCGGLEAYAEACPDSGIRKGCMLISCLNTAGYNSHGEYLPRGLAHSMLGLSPNHG